MNGSPVICEHQTYPASHPCAQDNRAVPTPCRDCITSGKPASSRAFSGGLGSSSNNMPLNNNYVSVSFRLSRDSTCIRTTPSDLCISLPLGEPARFSLSLSLSRVRLFPQKGTLEPFSFCILTSGEAASCHLGSHWHPQQNVDFLIIQLHLAVTGRNDGCKTLPLGAAICRHHAV